MKSQSNSQELTAEAIVSKFGLDASLWGALPDKYPKPKDPTPELLQLGLSCNLKKVKVPEGDNAFDARIGKYTTEDREREIIQAITLNSAIDTIEQNIRAKFQ